MGIIKTKYDQNYFENFFYKEKLNSQRNKNRIKELLMYKHGGKLLEVGCGEGNFLKEAEQYFDVTGVDISKHAIRNAKGLLRSKVSVKNVGEIKLQSNYYDVIMLFNLLEHLKTPRSVIKKLYRALKKDGILMGSVPNNFGVIGGLATLISNIVDKTHCSTYPSHFWYKCFRDGGFKKVFFFGEIMIGRNKNFYVKNRFWKFLSFNLMFICKKQLYN